ncbi:techylectin-5A-like [Stylophora pistillata]|nr:techylectin-5A-like [Stylophora pistillata]
MNFNLTWNDYKKGFGDFLIREFWLGLDKIQRLTQNKTENELRVDLGVTANKSVYAEYKWFGIENETANYTLHIGSFSNSSTVHDSLTRHNGMLFYTWDSSPAYHDCTSFGGGWWYWKTCHAPDSNLNGIYSHGNTSINQIRWARLNHGSAEDTAPKTTEMKIRRKDFL